MLTDQLATAISSMDGLTGQYHGDNIMIDDLIGSCLELLRILRKHEYTYLYPHANQRRKLMIGLV